VGLKAGLSSLLSSSPPPPPPLLFAVRDVTGRARASQAETPREPMLVEPLWATNFTGAQPVRKPRRRSRLTR
jgi:hypothetical protein